MKQKKEYIKVLCLFILITLNNACVNQNSSNEEVNKLSTFPATHSRESKKNTAAQLTFTTGLRSILEDRKGNFWFGSHQEGVAKFDGETLTYFTVADGLSNNQVRSIQEDQQGHIWFGTGDGISRYDGEKLTILETPTFMDDTKNDFYSIYKVSQGTWQKKPSDLWFHGGMNTGVYRFDGQQLHYLALPIPKNQEPNTHYLVTGFAKGKKDQLWIATYAGVFGYNGDSFTLINDESLGLQEDADRLHVRSVFEDSKGNLWIGNNGIGVLLHNGETTINFTKKQGRNSSVLLSSDGTLEHVFSIGEDQQGNIWFGDRDTGAWKYDGQLLTNYTLKDGLTATHIWAIYSGKRGELWFAMGDGSVCAFNGKSFERVY